LFLQLAETHAAQGSTYLAGLACLSAGGVATALGDRTRAASLLASATRALEQEADRKEQAGDRDAALRCYLCLIQIGLCEQSYENIAEGHLNCIRLLKAKSDRFATIQYYYELIRQAEALGEMRSAAS
jgi:hypothetical protein